MEPTSGRKILFVITKSNWGGAQAYVFALAKYFRERGEDVVVAYGGTGEAGGAPGLLAKRLGEAGIRTIFVPSFTRDIYFGHDLHSFFTLLGIIRRERPDIIHLNSSKAGGLGSLAASVAGVPRIVFTSHGLAYDEDRIFFVRGFIWLATWMTFLLSHAVILMSQDTYRRARWLPFCKKRVHLIHNGLVPIALKTREEARALLLGNSFESSPPHTVWIGMVAELTENKGIEYLIEAVFYLRTHNFSSKIWIIGSGTAEKKLKDMALKMSLEKYFVFLGFIEDAPSYLPAFDILLLTSVKEGFPYVLLEAGAAGCAVIASRIPGITDIITDGESGILVEPKRPSAIALTLDALMKDSEKRRALGAALHERVMHDFSQEKMTEKTSLVYFS